jgi:hypothetical protein
MIAFIMGILMLGMTFIISNALVGPEELSLNCATIVDGKTTREQTVRLLGPPEQKIQTDSFQLEEYLEELTLEKSDYPKGQYEIWKYFDWRYPSSSDTHHARQETLCSCLVVIDDRGVVIKKIYSETEIISLYLCKAAKDDCDRITKRGVPITFAPQATPKTPGQISRSPPSHYPTFFETLKVQSVIGVNSPGDPLVFI